MLCPALMPRQLSHLRVLDHLVGSASVQPGCGVLGCHVVCGSTRDQENCVHSCRCSLRLPVVFSVLAVVLISLLSLNSLSTEPASSGFVIFLVCFLYVVALRTLNAVQGGLPLPQPGTPVRSV